MTKSKYIDSKIMALKRVESGFAVPYICRELVSALQRFIIYGQDWSPDVVDVLGVNGVLKMVRPFLLVTLLGGTRYGPKKDL